MLTLFPAMRLCAAALIDLAFAVMAGALLNRLWLGKPSLCDRRLRVCVSLSAILLLIALPLQFLLLSASMIGDTSWRDAWQAMPDVAGTHAGHALLIGSCFVPCLLLLSQFPSAVAKRKGIFLGLSFEAALLACRAFNGHAASDGDFSLREAVQFSHLVSIATWAGGIIVAGIITVPRLVSAGRLEDLMQFGKRLSQTITVALAIVIASGIYNSWKGVGGSLTAMTHSAWGRMLLLKLFFVVLALAHGVRVRLLLKGRLSWRHDDAMIMQKWIRAEAILMVVVIGCSAWLANLPPADM